tara:strand:+ start:288 stop:506 length:219 start_codon:yes stop_codon:yes gene_type:complete
MSKEENKVGNPEIGMTEDSFESVDPSKTGSEDFFSALENDVNGSIQDDPSEATHMSAGPEMAYEPEVTQDAP